jgi:CHAT domain-containing protein
MPADLVVLSACRTGLGLELNGEGLVGLTQSFFNAGASRVLVSLWDVDDQATDRLMEHFYRELLQTGRPPGAALRAAQLSMRGDPRWSAPYYWAGFVLQGDWR